MRVAVADEQPGQRGADLPFEEALALALERWEHGQAPEAAAAAFPGHDLGAYLDLAHRLRALGRSPGCGDEHVRPAPRRGPRPP
jgi:hypothetical protein